MKKFIVTTLALVFAAWLATLHPRVGLAFYDAVGALEARIYGFQKSSVDIGDMQLSVYARNSEQARKTIILLHGYTASKEIWLRFANRLNPEYRVVIPDLAGHGETGFFSGWSYRASSQAKRVAQLMDKLGIERATIIGNSMGGMIAANFAIMYPQRATSIVLFNPAGITPPQPSVTEAMFAAGESPFEIDSQQQFFDFYQLTMAKPPVVPDFVLRGMALRYSERKADYAQIAQDFRFHDQLDGRLNQISTPTLIVWGNQDNILSPSAAPVWHQGIKDSQLHIFDGIGHMPMVEVPNESAQRVQAFLAE
ncbi:alpha/beta hydrolase [Pseudidiomarina gelatinasegens]|uniref:Alpha/beta hydrolase n=1 Tax=Pseudidiomarina gelatinasegens TaxID=2487740 RepID=A0A443YYF9_9GAMM|nr:alpha/beta hydrolase [Pseudidiomarina gelatinasegens]RWU09134.1 alpha/beta hydrolase [Pseudidiomarina gelatinasegens]